MHDRSKRILTSSSRLLLQKSLSPITHVRELTREWQGLLTPSTSEEEGFVTSIISARSRSILFFLLCLYRVILFLA